MNFDNFMETDPYFEKPEKEEQDADDARDNAIEKRRLRNIEPDILNYNEDDR